MFGKVEQLRRIACGFDFFNGHHGPYTSQVGLLRCGTQSPPLSLVAQKMYFTAN